MLARRVRQSHFVCFGCRQFCSSMRCQKKHIDHYATLCIPRAATKAQIKTSYYQLSKKYHPDVAKDNASQTKFHAVSEAYAILGDDRKRREYDHSLGSPFRAHVPGQHPQATATRPSQQPGSKHSWPIHPRNRSRDTTGGYRHAEPLYEHAGASSQRYRSGTQSPHTSRGSHTDPFTSPSVQRATGHRRSGYTRPNQHYQQGGSESATSTTWSASSGEGRRSSTAGGRPTQDEAAAESGVLRALGAIGLVSVILLVTAIGGNSKRTF